LLRLRHRSQGLLKRSNAAVDLVDRRLRRSLSCGQLGLGGRDLLQGLLAQSAVLDLLGSVTRLLERLVSGSGGLRRARTSAGLRQVDCCRCS
jgi:hypothetical protein